MIQTIVWLIAYALAIGLVVWLVNYVADAVPLPEPFNRFVKIVAVVLGVVALILLLLRLAEQF